MSKVYDVTLPIAGIAFLQVEADSEDEAIDVALGKLELKDIEEWDGHRYLVRGSVCYVSVTQAEAVEVADE